MLLSFLMAFATYVILQFSLSSSETKAVGFYLARCNHKVDKTFSLSMVCLWMIMPHLFI